MPAAVLAELERMRWSAPVECDGIPHFLSRSEPMDERLRLEEQIAAEQRTYCRHIEAAAMARRRIRSFKERLAAMEAAEARADVGEAD